MVEITKADAAQIISLIFWHTKQGEPMALKYRHLARRIADEHPSIADAKHNRSLFEGWYSPSEAKE